jgi:hypothetical protein
MLELILKKIFRGVPKLEQVTKSAICPLETETFLINENKKGAT